MARGGLLPGLFVEVSGLWNPNSEKFRGADLPVVASIAETIESARRSLPLEGVTFSGGEPMQQVEALVDLIGHIRIVSPWASLGMFTGYSEPELDQGQYATRPSTSCREKLWQIVRGQLDFAVMGRYDRTQPGTEPLRTSRNQKLVLFSSRYDGRDFDQQFVEVGIDQLGKAVVTGFPVLGSPAL